MKTFSLLVAAFRDLLIQKGFIRPKKPERAFAFIIHPRDLSDVARKYPFARFFPNIITTFLIKHLWPIVASKVTGLHDKQGREIPGWIVICPLSARQLIENKRLAKKRILQTIRLAECLGAHVVGLGALTSSVTNGGLDIAGEVSASLATGRTMTAIAVTEYLTYLLFYFQERIEERRIAIVGAGGSVGATTALLLAKKGARHLLLVDLERKSDRIERLIKELIGDREDFDIRKSHHIGDIKWADVIITATNAPEALVVSDDIRPGTIVIDDAQPSDVHPGVMKREDVLVIFGGIVKTPRVYSHFNFSLVERDENFSCLAETMLLARENIHKNFAIGHITMAQLERIDALARTVGFTIATLQNSACIYTKKDLDRIHSIRIKQNMHQEDNYV